MKYTKILAAAREYDRRMLVLKAKETELQRYGTDKARKANDTAMSEAWANFAGKVAAAAGIVESIDQPLTQTEYLEYANGDSGPLCPYCRSDQIEGHSMSVDHGSVNQRISCNNCGKDWFDYYELAAYQPPLEMKVSE